MKWPVNNYERLAGKLTGSDSSSTHPGQLRRSSSVKGFIAASMGSTADSFALESWHLRLRPVLLLGVGFWSCFTLSFSVPSGKRSPVVLLDDWIAGVLREELTAGVLALEVLKLSRRMAEFACSLPDLRCPPELRPGSSAEGCSIVRRRLVKSISPEMLDSRCQQLLIEVGDSEEGEGRSEGESVNVGSARNNRKACVALNT
jgi:hypothetical protein